MRVTEPLTGSEKEKLHNILRLLVFVGKTFLGTGTIEQSFFSEKAKLHKAPFGFRM